LESCCNNSFSCKFVLFSNRSGCHILKCSKYCAI
jgi:hypothetical protein